MNIFIRLCREFTQVRDPDVSFRIKHFSSICSVSLQSPEYFVFACFYLIHLYLYCCLLEGFCEPYLNVFLHDFVQFCFLSYRYFLDVTDTSSFYDFELGICLNSCSNISALSSFVSSPEHVALHSPVFLSQLLCTMTIISLFHISLTFHFTLWIAPYMSHLHFVFSCVLLILTLQQCKLLSPGDRRVEINFTRYF